MFSFLLQISVFFEFLLTFMNQNIFKNRNKTFTGKNVDKTRDERDKDKPSGSKIQA